MNSLSDLFREARKACPDPESRKAGAIVVGAYWFLTHHHSGQGSWQYEALCKLGEIYSPGMLECGPDPGTPEMDVYDHLHVADCESATR